MTKMPVVFVGHGSPMNVIENNAFTKGWETMAKALPAPQAILMISAHWFGRGLKINNAIHPKMMYDMYGFPEPVYKIVYNSPGAPQLAEKVSKLLPGQVTVDNSWGYDHGNWAVLHKMYPDHDIPITQLSVDLSRTPESIYELAHALQPLRNEGVLIMGSGNIVHNLREVDWNKEQGFDWANDFDHTIRDLVKSGKHLSIIDQLTDCSHNTRLSVPTIEHFLPLIYVLGASNPDEEVQVFNDTRTLGSMSMTSFIIG